MDCPFRNRKKKVRNNNTKTDINFKFNVDTLSHIKFYLQIDGAFHIYSRLLSHVFKLK